MGGMTNWNTGSGGTARSARSPVKLGSAKPNWVLAADALVRDPTGWGHLAGLAPVYTVNGVTFSTWDGIPPHRNRTGMTPSGGNEVFADGSATWIKYDQMYLLHQYPGSTGPRWFFWYQDPNDFGIPAFVLPGFLKSISAENFQ